MKKQSIDRTRKPMFRSAQALIVLLVVGCATPHDSLPAETPAVEVDLEGAPEASATLDDPLPVDKSAVYVAQEGAPEAGMGGARPGDFVRIWTSSSAAVSGFVDAAGASWIEASEGTLGDRRRFRRQDVWKIEVLGAKWQSFSHGDPPSTVEAIEEQDQRPDSFFLEADGVSRRETRAARRTSGRFFSRALAPRGRWSQGDFESMAKRIANENPGGSSYNIAFFSDPYCFTDWDGSALLRRPDWDCWLCWLYLERGRNGVLLVRSFNLAKDYETGEDRIDVLGAE